MQSRPWVLFGRKICPLCDDAALLLDSIGLVWHERDIDDDIALLARYRDRIPVLRDEQSGRELGWPFNHEQLLEFTNAV